MKRLIIVAVVIGTAIVIFQWAYPSVTIRYRLTLEAEVDGKPTIGSSVIEVTYRANIGGTAEYVTNVRGEAVVLDLGKRGTLFALLKEGQDSRSGPDYIVLRAFGFPGGAFPRPIGKGTSDVGKLAGKVPLPFEHLPMLVRFRNISDPLTVERVNPNDLGKPFGPGANLTRATLEIVPAGIWPFSWFGITGEPLTDSLETRLAWLRGTKGGYLDGKFAGGGPALSNALHGGNFKTGLYR